MAPLSKLTLTSYRRTQPNGDPIEERRSKTLAAIEQQKLVLAAAQKGQKHRVKKHMNLTSIKRFEPIKFGTHD